MTLEILTIVGTIISAGLSGGGVSYILSLRQQRRKLGAEADEAEARAMVAQVSALTATIETLSKRVNDLQERVNFLEAALAKSEETVRTLTAGEGARNKNGGRLRL